MSADRGPLPQLAITLPQFTDDPDRPLAAARHARSLGYAGAFVFDHLMWPLGARDAPVLEGWSLLGALAAAVGSRRFRLGTLVTRASLRPPALLARMAAAAGEAAGAPLVVGVGGGDQLTHPENLAYGLHASGPAAREAEVERAARALTGPLAGDPRPEVWIGGTGRRMRAAAGRAADAWNVWGVTAEALAAGLAEVRRAAEAAGRDPAAVTATWGGQVVVDADPARADAFAERRRAASGGGGVEGDLIVGEPGTVLDALASLRAAGASWCVLSFVGGDPGPMRALLARAAGLRQQAD